MPFLLSIVLVIIGYWVRIAVDESPVFEEIAQRKEQEAENPLKRLFSQHGLLVLVAALLFAGNNAVGYMTTGGYIQNYSTNPDGIGLDRGAVLVAVSVSGVTWMVFTLLAGWVSDRIGRRATYLIGFVVQALGAAALFPLVNTGSIAMLYVALIFLTLGLGLTYGQQSATYAELFPAPIRSSGVSIAYAIGAVLGGAFAPTIAAALVNATGTTFAVSGYLVTASIVGLIAAFVLRERGGIPLGPEHEEIQSQGHFVFQPHPAKRSENA